MWNYTFYLCHYGVPGMKWGKRKSSTNRRSSGSLKNRMSKMSSTSYRKPKISSKERQHILSELMTNMTRDQRTQLVISKHIGDYLYTFIKRSEGVYDPINKKKIK